ncbi:MAG: hypothetical protein IKR34_02655 [Candidatus Gastranaerophilales bacterium]|nr:hypothetical protein [Candidatus Gastranaerophilales bacterium]
MWDFSARTPFFPLIFQKQMMNFSRCREKPHLPDRSSEKKCGIFEKKPHFPLWVLKLKPGIFAFIPIFRCDLQEKNVGFLRKLARLKIVM